VFPSGGDPQAPAFLRFLADPDARELGQLPGSWVTPRSPVRHLHRAKDLYGTSRNPAGVPPQHVCFCSDSSVRNVRAGRCCHS